MSIIFTGIVFSRLTSVHYLLLDILYLLGRIKASIWDYLNSGAEQTTYLPRLHYILVDTWPMHKVVLPVLFVLAALIHIIFHCINLAKYHLALNFRHITGIVLTIIMLLGFGISIFAKYKKFSYEYFIYPHVITTLIVAAMIPYHGNSTHSKYLQRYGGTMIAALILDKLILWLLNFRVCELSIPKNKKDGSMYTIELKDKLPFRLRARCGQYYRLMVPMINWTEFHSFTVVQGVGEENDRFIIKDQGEGSWTRKLINQLENNNKYIGFLASPSPTVTQMFTYTRFYDCAVVVSSGSGLSVAASMAQFILANPTEFYYVTNDIQRCRPVTIVYVSDSGLSSCYDFEELNNTEMFKNFHNVFMHARTKNVNGVDLITDEMRTLQIDSSRITEKNIEGLIEQTLVLATYGKARRPDQKYSPFGRASADKKFGSITCAVFLSGSPGIMELTEKVVHDFKKRHSVTFNVYKEEY